MAIYDQIANPQGINLPAINNAAQTTMFNKLKIDQIRAGMQKQNRLSELAQGGREAIPEIVKIDPEFASQMTDMYGKLDENQRKTWEFNTEQVARALQTVASANELEKPVVYQKARQYAIQHLGADPKTIPENYDPNFVQQSLNQAVSATEWFKQNQGQKPTNLMQNLEAAGLKPGTPEYQAAIIKAETKPMTSILPGEKEEQKAYGKTLVGQYDEIYARGQAASDAIMQLDIAKNIDVSSGALEPFKNSVAAFAQGLGFDPANIGLDKADNAQAFTGIMQNLVLTKMQAQKGPQTENDAKRIQMTVSSISNTKEAKDFIIDASIALEKRKVEMSNFYEAYRAKNGTFQGANIAWGQYKAKTPIMGKNPKTGRPVFYNQFRDAVLEANPGASDEDITKLWRQKYAK